jgi:hypothetical protein
MYRNPKPLQNAHKTWHYVRETNKNNAEYSSN